MREFLHPHLKAHLPSLQAACADGARQSLAMWNQEKTLLFLYVFVDIFINAFWTPTWLTSLGCVILIANIQWGFTCGDFCIFSELKTIQSIWWDCCRIMECYRMTEWLDHDFWKDMMRSISWDLLKLHRSKRDSLKPAVICQCPEATRTYKHRPQYPLHFYHSALPSGTWNARWRRSSRMFPKP